MPATAKPRAKPRRRRRDGGGEDDDDHSHASSHSASESGSDADSESDVSDASGDEDEEAESDAEPVVVSFDEFTSKPDDDTPEAKPASPSPKPSHTEPRPPSPAKHEPTPPRGPRPASNRAAYLAKIAADPTFVPRVGKFWTHDERHYAAGRVGQGGSEYAGLREMSEYWRDRGRGRGRGRGFVRGRGVARPPMQERPTQDRATQDSTPGKDVKPDTTANDTPAIPVSGSDETAVSQSAVSQSASKSSWNGDVGRSERGSWSHDGYAELAREEERRAAARERQQQILMASGRGRGMVRGMFRGRGRGRGAFPVPAPRTPEQSVGPESVDAAAPLPESSSGESQPVVKLPAASPVPDTTRFIPLFSDHEPSAITAHLQTQAEHAERIQQQELKQRQQTALEDDMRRLEIGQQRVQSLGASSDAGSHSSAHLPPPPNMLPPGIGMTESGAFYDVVTGQAVVWVPSPSPGPMPGQPPMSIGAAMANNASRMGYNPYTPDMGVPYGYPSQFAGYQPPYSGYPRPSHLADPYPYAPPFMSGRDSASPYPMPGYNMHAPPQLSDPTYFMPPRPQSKIQIRAPAASGEASSPRGHLPNPAEIAAATLKDPSKHGARSSDATAQAQESGYHYSAVNAQYMHPQQGYYPQQYMPMGY